MTSQKRAFPKVLVCQNTTCQQQGSEKVLTAFERCAPDDVSVEISGCLGQCGKGPMVVVLSENAEVEKVEFDEEIGKERAFSLSTAEKEGGENQKPQKTWYSAVKPVDAFAIASQHFKDAPPPVRKQSVQLQTKNSFLWIWLVGAALFLAMCGLLALVLGGPSHYG